MILVRNITNRLINLANGGIRPGQTGMAEKYEVETLFNAIEPVTELPPLPIRKPVRPKND